MHKIIPNYWLKKVADLILSENIQGIKVNETGKIVNDLSKLPKDGTLSLASRYKTWGYWNGVLNTAMLEMYKQFKEENIRITHSAIIIFSSTITKF